ncbi:MAG TPA: ATP-binding protein [Solirubrobacteraceae bacterium]|nr:ATP-binding protein [Solirubrobacteraceae bacterium]
MDSRPEAPAVVRAALTGVAQLLALDPELFDDLKTAVSEACNNVVLYAYDGKPGPLVVELDIRAGAIAASVRDWGGGIQHVGSSEERMGIGLAVISALADRAEFITPPDGGTEVRMSFAGRAAAIRTHARSPDGERPSAVPVTLSGDVVVTVSPVAVLAGILGRVTRAVAARTHLSVDRFSDIRLLTDAIAAFAITAAGGAAVTFAVTGSHKRVELTLGPFRAGAGAALTEAGRLGASGSPFPAALSEFVVEPLGGSELLRVVVEERPA